MNSSGCRRAAPQTHGTGASAAGGATRRLPGETGSTVSVAACRDVRFPRERRRRRDQTPGFHGPVDTDVCRRPLQRRVRLSSAPQNDVMRTEAGAPRAKEETARRSRRRSTDTPVRRTESDEIEIRRGTVSCCGTCRRPCPEGMGRAGVRPAAEATPGLLPGHHPA